MSQMRPMRFELRAMLIIAAVSALVFSLVASGSAFAAKSDGPGLYSIASAHMRAMGCNNAGSSDVAAHDPAAPKKSSHHADCPDCCRAPASAAAVLPERTGGCARRVGDVAPIYFSPFSCGEPENSIPTAVNGARAPPASWGVL